LSAYSAAREPATIFERKGNAMGNNRRKRGEGKISRGPRCNELYVGGGVRPPCLKNKARQRHREDKKQLREERKIVAVEKDFANFISP